jgi:sugar phosphate isomerase/epimerase
MRVPILLSVLLFGALAWAEDATLRGGNMLSCETYSYRQLIAAGKLDMVSAPAFYKQEGIPGISYNDSFFKQRDDVYIDQVKAAVKAAGRVVTCFVIEGNLAQADEAKRRQQIEYDKAGLRVAYRLGAPVVRINVGRTGPQENADDTLGVERVIAAFKELLPLARQLNLRLAIENHGGVSKTAANIVKIIQGTDRRRVGALVDFGNFPDAVRYDEVARVAPYAFVTHVKINEFDERGEASSIDFPRILNMLKAQKYKGSLSIEYEGKGDPVEGVRKSKALILKYW